MQEKGLLYIIAAFAKSLAIPGKRELFFIAVLFSLVLNSCSSLPPEVRADIEKQQRMSIASANLRQSEDKAILWLSDNKEHMDWALVMAMLGDRLDLLDYTISQGVDINQPVTCDVALVFAETLHFYSSHSRLDDPANLLSHHNRVFDVLDPGSPGTNLWEQSRSCPGLFSFRAAEHPRSLAALERLIAAGADFDQRTLDRALASVVIATADTELADKLVAMGATVDQPARAVHRMPLFFEAVTLGRVAMVRWMLENGVDPNQRASLAVYQVGESGAVSDDPPVQATEVTALHVLAGRILAPELHSDYLNPASQRNAHYIAYHERVASIAQLLIDSGAQIDATAAWQGVPGSEPVLAELTPLHVAMFHRGSTFIQGDQSLPKENRQLIAALVANGANQLARNSQGQTPNEVGDYVFAERQRRRAVEQQLAQNRLQPTRGSSGNSFGQILASFGMLAVTGAAIDSGVDPVSAAQIGGSGLLDIVTDGNARALEQVNQSQQQSQPDQTMATAGQSTSSSFQTETYSLTCPSNETNNIPLRYKTQQCRAAMIELATAYGCNDLRNPEYQQSLHSNCQSACGHPNCGQQ